ncbi:unnamed protein product [Mucor hiemalis]
MVYWYLKLLNYNDIQIEDEDRSPWKFLLKGFVHIPTGSDLIQGLVKNDKNIYKDFIDELLHGAHNSPNSIRLSEMIFKIVEEYPDYAYMTRFKAVEMQVLPDLITKLTIIYCRDTVEFLNGMFHGNSMWFQAQSVNSGQYFVKMKQRIIADIDAQSSDLVSNHVEIACAMRALAGIVGYFGIKLMEAEAVVILKILGTTDNERLVLLSICLMLLSADQFIKKQNDLSQILTRLLQSDISEMPLLVLVYFQTDAIQQVEDSIRSILAMQVPIAKFGLFEMQKLFRSLRPHAI